MYLQNRTRQNVTLLAASIILLAFNASAVTAQVTVSLGDNSLQKNLPPTISRQARPVIGNKLLSNRLPNWRINQDLEGPQTSDDESKDKGQDIVENDAASTASDEMEAADQEARANSQDDGESKLLDSLPVARLRGGIAYNSMQRAVAKRDVPDPLIQVAMSSQYASPQYRYGQSVIWKTWESPNVAYCPLYFEEPNVERYGNHFGAKQPIVSGLHFFTNILALPYKKAAYGTCAKEYGLGYARPGDCTEAYWSSIGKSKRGFAAQVLTVGAIVVAL